jgi:hypothetical protein
VRLIEVEQDQLRFTGQQTKPAQTFMLCLCEAQTAHWTLRLQRFLTALEQSVFTVQLRIADFFDIFAETFEPFFHHLQISQEQFIIEREKIPNGIHAALRMRHRWMVKRPHHVRQSIGIPHERHETLHETRSLLPGYKRVNKFDGGGRHFAWVVHGRQGI